MLFKTGCIAPAHRRAVPKWRHCASQGDILPVSSAHRMLVQAYNIVSPQPMVLAVTTLLSLLQKRSTGFSTPTAHWSQWPWAPTPPFSANEATLLNSFTSNKEFQGKRRHPEKQLKEASRRGLTNKDAESTKRSQKTPTGPSGEPPEDSQRTHRGPTVLQKGS